MAVSWEYHLHFILNKLFGGSIFTKPLDLLMIVIYLIAGIFLIGIIYQLYKSYKTSESVETLLFLLGMISLLIANVVIIFRKLVYSTFGLPDFGEFLQLFNLFPTQFTYMCVDLFAIRMTFPKRYKLVLVILLILSVILVGTLFWAITQGPPYYNIINFEIVYSLEIVLIRFLILIPIGVIPISVFFYFSKNIREENRPQSNLTFWLGMGILFFVLAILLTTITIEFRFFQILYIPAAITFYICFAKPDWFKRRIGLTD